MKYLRILFFFFLSSISAFATLSKSDARNIVNVIASGGITFSWQLVSVTSGTPAHFTFNVTVTGSRSFTAGDYWNGGESLFQAYGWVETYGPVSGSPATFQVTLTESTNYALKTYTFDGENNVTNLVNTDSFHCPSYNWWLQNPNDPSKTGSLTIGGDPPPDGIKSVAAALAAAQAAANAKAAQADAAAKAGVSSDAAGVAAQKANDAAAKAAAYAAGNATSADLANAQAAATAAAIAAQNAATAAANSNANNIVAAINAAAAKPSSVGGFNDSNIVNAINTGNLTLSAMKDALTASSGAGNVDPIVVNNGIDPNADYSGMRITQEKNPRQSVDQLRNKVSQLGGIRPRIEIPSTTDYTFTLPFPFLDHDLNFDLSQYAGTISVMRGFTKYLLAFGFFFACLNRIKGWFADAS